MYIPHQMIGTTSISKNKELLQLPMVKSEEERRETRWQQAIGTDHRSPLIGSDSAAGCQLSRRSNPMGRQVVQRCCAAVAKVREKAEIFFPCLFI